jgi:hypothetical protein
MGFYSNTDVHFNHEGSRPIFEFKDWNGHGIWDYFTFSMQQSEPHELSNNFNVTGHKVTLFITEDQLREMRDKASEALRSRSPLTEDQEAYRVAGQTFMEDPSPENFVALANACDPMMPGVTDTDIIRVIKQNVVQDCLKAIKSNCNAPVDHLGLGYSMALADVIQAVEALLPQQQGKTLMEVFAEEETKEAVVPSVCIPCFDEGHECKATFGCHSVALKPGEMPQDAVYRWKKQQNPNYDHRVIEEAISYNSDPHPVTC